MIENNLPPEAIVMKPGAAIRILAISAIILIGACVRVGTPQPSVSKGGEAGEPPLGDELQDRITPIIGSYAVFPATCDETGSPRLLVTKTAISDFSGQLDPWKVDIALTQRWSRVASAGVGANKDVPIYLTFSVVPDNQIAVSAFTVFRPEDFRTTLAVLGDLPDHPIGKPSERPPLGVIRYMFDHPPSVEELSNLMNDPNNAQDNFALLQPC